ncbi:hypothetical protein [uncultured Tateyamaria sp.]|uniref:hypothetical protein n=1 Tax=uncultured Tateyamaria sp. TaxID=455651 RepID=UPI00262DE076|nr:hypothetical protein [uncultured Tateyamaria sp.]
MQEVSLVTNGHVEALGSAKDLILQLMIMSAGVFAIFAGFASSASPGALSKPLVGWALALFSLSIFFGYLAFGGVIASYNSESFDAYSGVIVTNGILQLGSFLSGGICLILTIIRKVS